MTAIEWWRLGNLFLCLLALSWLLIDFYYVHAHLSKRRLYLTLALGWMLLVVIVSSIEGIMQDNPIGLRTAMVPTGAFWVMIALSQEDKE